MATFENQFYKNGYAVRMICTVNSQNIANNTTNVTVSVHLVSLGSSYTIRSENNTTGTVTINGTTYSFSFPKALSGNQNRTVYSASHNITHNADGTKTLSLSATLNVNATLSQKYYGAETVSGSVALTAIPRQTPVSVSGSATFGSSKWIGHSRASSSFTVTLRYACGSASGTIVSKSATNETYWTPPKDLQKQIPKSTSITITIYCDTYNGNTLIGTTSTSLTCHIASDCVPTISGCTFTNIRTNNSTYYQSVDSVRMTASVAGAYDSTISKYEFTIDGKTYVNYGNVKDSDVIYTSGNKDVKLVITDSRGKTATKTWTSAVYITPYSRPNITNFTCRRTGIDEAGNEVNSNLGTIGYFTASGTFHANSSGHVRKFMYKPTGGSTWTTITLGDENQTNFQFSTSLASGSAYDLKYILTDNVTTTEKQIKMQNLFPLINMNGAGNGIAFGKESTIENRLAVGMDAAFDKWCGINSLQVMGNATFDGSIYMRSGKRVFSVTDTDFYINMDRAYDRTTIYGPTSIRDRKSDLTIFRVMTTDDGNGNGDGNTMLGYYQAEHGGFGHYFRGKGQMYIHCHQGVTISNKLACASKFYCDTISYNSTGGYTDANGSDTWGVGCDHHFLPVYDTRYLGTSAHRWQQLYCVSSPSVSSDARNKENVKYMYNQPEVVSEYTDVKENDEITTHDLLDFVLNDLYMVTFDYKQNTDGMEEGEIEQVTAMNNRQIGFIAQDIENTKVGKYLVTKDSEGILSYESANWPSIIAGALQQEIRDRQAADKELMDMLNDIINE